VGGAAGDGAGDGAGGTASGETAIPARGVYVRQLAMSIGSDVPQCQLFGPPSTGSLASFVPSRMTRMSHVFCVSVVYCGRCQYGESPFGAFCIVEPHAPRFVTAYLPGA